MQPVWRVHPADPRQAQRLSLESGVHPLTAQLLLNRGIRTAQEVSRFFHPTLDTLTDPRALPDLPKGVARLQQAVAAGEPILVFGDSDVDGLTASVVLYEVLRGLGASVRAKQSNRIADRYGLPDALVQRLCRSSVKVVVLVDCGTNQPEAVRRLAACGIDTIIVDHHVPLDGWATPYALINPHRDPRGPWRELSSAGLAFKVAQALLGGEDDGRLEACLDLAALGLLADYAPLIGESRVLIAAGLPRIVSSHRRGLHALCEATQTTQPEPDQIAKRLVPRLNASGRLGDPAAVWNLLLSEEEGIERWLAEADAAHTTTKQLHRQLIGEAYEQINRLNFRDHYVLIVSRSGWHQGLMGPLAAQMAQQYGRPTIAIAMDERDGIGSGRSIPLFNLLDALKACQGLLTRFGGHAQACGLTVDRRQLEPFRELVNQHARVSLGRQGLVKTRTIDLELPLSAVESGWVGEVDRFAPFGQGNPRPTVVIRRVTIEPKSPRTAVISDGTVRMLGKGSYPAGVAGASYDVVAIPSLAEGELVLTLSDAKASAAP